MKQFQYNGFIDDGFTIWKGSDDDFNLLLTRLAEESGLEFTTEKAEDPTTTPIPLLDIAITTHSNERQLLQIDYNV